MSLPSYKLSKTGGRWWAEGKLDSGRPFRVDCGAGTSSRDRADAVAELHVKNKLKASHGAKARWKKFYANKATTRPAGNTTAAAAPEPLEQGNTEPPPAAARPRLSDNELRAKLLHLGDASSSGPEAVEADKVIGKDEPRYDEQPEDEDDPGLTNEEGELLADVLATGLTTGLVWGVNRRLKKRTPPMQAEPHEKGLDWFQRGAAYNLKKLLGTSATLGPTGKMFVGAGIIVGSMLMNAEPIDPRDYQRAQEPAPPPPQPHAPAAANGAHQEPQQTSTSTSLAVQGGSPLGVFGVGKTTAN